MKPTTELLERFRRFIRGDDTVTFDAEEHAWMLKDGWRHVTLVPLEEKEDGDADQP